MAFPGFPWLLLSVLIVAMPLPGSCVERAPLGSLLIQCDDPAMVLTNGTQFRASLIPLLAALPSAAAPTGFASLRSNGHDRAFVRGLCFGNSTAPSECLGCLAVAARNLTSGCSATTRRAGIWSDRCFLAYADTDASSPSEGAFRSRVLLRGDDAVPVPHSNAGYLYEYMHAQLVTMAQLVAQSAAANISWPRMLATADAATDDSCVPRSKVHVLAQCARDRTMAECVRCLQDSARAVDWDLDADRCDGGVAAAVVGFNCYLRFEVSTTVVWPQKTDSGVSLFIIVVASFAVVFGCAFCALLLHEEKMPKQEKKDAAAAGECIK